MEKSICNINQQFFNKSQTYFKCLKSNYFIIQTRRSRANINTAQHAALTSFFHGKTNQNLQEYFLIRQQLGLRTDSVENWYGKSRRRIVNYGLQKIIFFYPTRIQICCFC